MVRIILALLMITMLSACGNPLGGDEGASDINDGHDPLDPVDNVLGAFTLSGSVTSPTSVNISWTNSENADTYTLEYGTASGTYTTVVSTTATSPTPVTGLTPGTNYYFLATATNETGTLVSNEIVVGSIGTFSITGVTSGASSATLSWANATGATDYKVSYGTASGIYGTVASNNATSPLQITGLTPGTTYYFKVEARNSSTTQLSSNEISAVPLAAFTMAATGGDESADVTWVSSAGATSYTLKYGTATGVYGTTVSTNATSPATITGLTPGTTYYFMVEAVNATGTIQATTEASAAPSGTPSATDSTIVADIPKDLIANGTTTNTLTVTIRTASLAGLAGKVVSVTSSRGATDTITAVTATTNSSGVATFTVRSSTTGAAVLTAQVTADSFTITQTETVYFFPEHPYVDMQGRFANTTQGINNPGGTTTWLNKGTGGASFNGTLANFSLDSSLITSRWGGNGTTSITNANTGQYRLIFDGVDDTVNLGTGLNSNTSIAYDTWLRPNALTRGKVIISNANTSSKGLTLRQRWDGQGGLTLSPGHQSYADVIATDNPVGYWRLGESGATFYNSGTATNMNATKIAGVTNGAVGVLANDSDTAATFTKPTDDSGALTVPDHASLDGMTALSMEAWVYTNSSCTGASVNCGIISKRVNSGISEAYIFYISSKLPTLRIAGNAGTQLNGTTVLADNTWYHLVAVFDPSLSDAGTTPSTTHRMKIYVNGVLTNTRTNSSSPSIPATASDFAIGHLYGNTASGWSGPMDEVAIYNYALTQAQITAHYNASTLHAVHSTANMSVGTWAHVGASFNGGTGALNLSLNGTNATKTYASTNIATSTSNWMLGASSFSGTSANFWDGAIGDFRVYTRAFSGAELNACYSATSAKFP